MSKTSRLTIIMVAVALIAMPGAKVVAAGGPFSVSNGYFSVSGNDGLIDELKLDYSGSGSYDSNTIGPGGHFGFTVDSTLQQSANCNYSYDGNSVTITNLPDVDSMIISLVNDKMTVTLAFSGTKSVQQDWIQDFRADGFYQRSTGQNTNPNVSVDMPFESFYGTVGGNYSFVPVESMKNRSTDTISLTQKKIRCRARASRDDSVIYECSHATATFLPTATALYLRNGPANATSPVTVTLDVAKKTYSSIVDGKALPEFYVSPATTISALSDPNNVQHDANDLLTELFQHTTFWWGPNGSAPWIGWSSRTGCYMDNSYRAHVKGGLQGASIGDDGYGSDYGYFYTWGNQRGWPFPSGKDTRHFNTNANWLNALARYVTWSGDRAVLLSGHADMDLQILYSDSSTARTMSDGQINTPYRCYEDASSSDKYSLGQSFSASKPFTKVASHNPTWGTTTSDFTLSLYDKPGGTLLVQKTVTDANDNAWNELTFDALPAGNYYLHMSDVSGIVGWWGANNASGTDVYTDGEAHRFGYPFYDVINKARALMDYQQNTLNGSTNNLLILSYANIGSHDHEGVNGNDVGSNWYDILPFGYKSILTNISYYDSLDSMAKVEDIMDASTTAQSYRNQRSSVRSTFNSTLWRTGLDANSDEGRYIVTVDSGDNDHDYGFTGLNLMAAASGLPDANMVSDMFDWLDNGQSWHHDNQWHNDIYSRWKFAARLNTIDNEDWWAYGQSYYTWDDQIQNGGASLHESGFDIEARAHNVSADSAWNRLKTILQRYADPDRLCQRNGYYGEEVQGGDNGAGAVGWMWSEFPETTVLGGAFFRGFFEPTTDANALTMEPHVPTELDSIGVRNISYYGALFDFEATDSNMTIKCTANSGSQTFDVNGTDYSSTFTTTESLDGNGRVTIVAVVDSTAPNSPSNLSVSDPCIGHRLNLDWDNNSENDLVGYNVLRGTATGGPYNQINSNIVLDSDYTDDNANTGTTYYYVVTAVDEVMNESSLSSEVNDAATSTADSNAPWPDPETWKTKPNATGTTSIAMTATPAYDRNGVQYYFEETSGNPGGDDSSWQDSPDYEDTGLNSDTTYSYRVKTRDLSAGSNVSGWSSTESATTDADCGAATMYRDGAAGKVSALSSVSNALLPLIPAMGAIGLWIAARRKRR